MADDKRVKTEERKTLATIEVEMLDRRLKY